MRRIALLATLLVILGGRGSAADEDGKPDSVYCAKLILEGDDAEYRVVRQRLAKRPNSELLAILDALRSEAAARETPTMGLCYGMWRIPATDPGARKEGPLLACAVGEATPWLVRIESHLMAVPDSPMLRRLRSYVPEKSDQVHAIPADVASSLIPRPHTPVAPRRERLPALDLFDGQTGMLRLGAQVRFLMDYKTSGSQNLEIRPVVGGIPEGVEISVTARRSKDPARLTLQVDARWTEMRRPVDLYRVQISGPETEKTIQLPELLITQRRGTAEVALGDWLVAGTRPSGPGEHPRFLLLRAVRLPPPTVPIEQPGAAPLAPVPAPGGGAGGSCGK